MVYIYVYIYIYIYIYIDEINHRISKWLPLYPCTSQDSVAFGMFSAADWI